ncbi:MAG: DNA polymerase III subunit alpha [Oscillospiraceae bacterium]|nr:DNA polymerase III subunit alpha [Oscillospiraceae bacterium]
MPFVHLHTHSAFSLLDGQGRIENLIAAAKTQGQTAMAITDHGAMYGVIDFYERAKKHGIKPIIGCEIYTAARRMTDKTHEHDSKSGHLILLAKNNVGYQNLMKIVSFAFTDGFYYKPRADMELLRENSEGIIATSACLYGDIPQLIVQGNYNGAVEKARAFIDIFGKDNFFIELQDHGMIEQRRANKDLIRLARELDLRLVATNDIHYVNKRDAEYQDVLMAIQTGKTLDDPDRMKFDGSEMYVKSESEMLELFDYIPEAIENTQLVADMCNVELDFDSLHLPQFDTPNEADAYEYLKQLCHEGLKKRYGDLISDEIAERIKYELSMINKMGYVDYFLIVWDFCKFARDNGISVGPGRGSAAGSLVSYCLFITDIDPLKFGLLFERFLNPERISMPDIDIDFCERRQEVIDYVINKYGEDHVTQIITFGTMAARAAIRDVGRVLNIPYGTVDNIAKAVPFELGMTIAKALKRAPKLEEMYNSDADVKRVIDYAREVEGLPRHTSTHAAGVVITKEPLYQYVPLQKKDDVTTTQYPMGDIEKLGLLKMDFLGLNTLTIIKDTIENVKQSHNVYIDLASINLDDKEVYDMFSRGETDGVFQFESSGMRGFLKELKPRCLEDLIAATSLYRPGPMDSIPTYVRNKNNPSLVTYKHPTLENILDVTYGCIVYQEQVMQIVRELGGYSLGRADLLRRAMSKKKPEVMKQERENFIHGIIDENGDIEVSGAVRRGIDEKIAASIFDEIMDFANYAFNKSHAAAYALIAYQTAFLKCHFPVDFMAALLSNTHQVTKHILECKNRGISVLPPDVNKSRSGFTVDNNLQNSAIRFGLVAVKNVGAAFVQKMLAERDKNGEFKSFTDFCTRMASADLNKRVVEALISCGAFDSMGLKRSVLLAEHEKVISGAVGDKRNNLTGQLDLFSMSNDSRTADSDDNFEDKPEFSYDELLNLEREFLGFYVSGHPLDTFKEVITANSDFSTLDIANAQNAEETENSPLHDGMTISICGMISARKNKVTKAGKTMCFLSLEDLVGRVEVIVFADKLARYDQYLEVNKIVRLTGRLDIKEDEDPKIICESIMLYNPK